MDTKKRVLDLAAAAGLTPTREMGMAEARGNVRTVLSMDPAAFGQMLADGIAGTVRDTFPGASEARRANVLRAVAASLTALADGAPPDPDIAG